MNIIHKAIGKTDVGLVRKNNEDNLYLDHENGIYAVCDGMGGHQAGEVASQAAVELINEIFDNLQDKVYNYKELMPLPEPIPRKGNILAKAIRLANKLIYNRAARDTSKSGMGTTVAAIALEDDYISIAHVGDSRVYRLNNDGLKQLTEDHSWIVEVQKTSELTEEELNMIMGRNVITRALGVKETVQVDFSVVKVEKGDVIILCSDGLCGLTSNDEIFDVANPLKDNIEQLVDKLIELAHNLGGNDNVTVIAVKIEDLIKTVNESIFPFTIEEENPEVQILEDRFLIELSEKKPKSGNKRKKKNKLFLFGIFLSFVIVAAAMIFMASGK